MLKDVKKNPNKINYLYLSFNDNGINIIKENLDKINWCYLSGNENAINLIKKNQEKINWDNLSSNSNAIELIKENQNKIDWVYLSCNQSIFTYDYEKIKENKKELNEEIIIKALHPKRILILMETYGEEEIYKCYFDDD